MVKWFLPLLAVGMLACSEQAAEKEQHAAEEKPAPAPVKSLQAQVLDTSRYLSQQAFQALSSVLMAQIEEVGPAGAVPFCNERALPLTDSVAWQHGISIRRIASRYRNPANAANEAESAMLLEWEKAIAALEQPKVRWFDQGDSISWYGAITIPNPRCLHCHGLLKEGDIHPKTMAQIKRYYPNDRAVNFELGDLRGMWKISYPKAFFVR